MAHLWPIYLMPYTFTVLVTVLVSMHRYCTVCKPLVMSCARISSAAVSRSSSWFSPSNAPQARRRVASLALFSVIYNIPRFFEYEPTGRLLLHGVAGTHVRVVLRVFFGVSKILCYFWNKGPFYASCVGIISESDFGVCQTFCVIFGTRVCSTPGCSRVYSRRE